MTNFAHYTFGVLALFFAGFLWSYHVGGGISLLIAGLAILLPLKDKADKYTNNTEDEHPSSF